ncbi:hypothetical protein PHLGIDRAFT_129422 [Phlebiopsis gigantea 11061_1 CR5-6]|uniref:F-box domain-containing protein n=1 Tax=Phlebiopsis gigantea (strain 11061_1 CR5-6) TaxID=745531 RepID=A0A0C3S3Q3_PHLG1|nr:hypothetical protein PHLGIDRAFT_129422 [Phlebiopsis gigantea 11061_1 CR5-6]
MQAPVEVIEQIVDHLRPEDSETTKVPALDKGDLRSCSLVSKVWLAASKPMLFQDVGYTVSARPQAADVKPRTLQAISSFFNEHRDVAGYIQKLWIGQQSAGGVKEEDGLALDHLRKLLHHFTRLRELNLVDLVISCSSDPPQALPSFLMPLKTLNIICSRHFSDLSRQSHPWNVTDILRYFTTIDTLSLINTPWTEVSDLEKSSPAVPPTVQALILHGVPAHRDRDIECVLLRLPRLVDIKSVRTLYFTSDTWGQHRGLFELFAPSLEKLWMLPCPWFDRPGHNRRSQVFSSFTKLKQIAFPLTLDTFEGDPPNLDFEELQRALIAAGLTKRQHTGLEELVLLIKPFTAYQDEGEEKLQNTLDAALVEAVRQNNIVKVGFEWCGDLWQFSHTELEDGMRKLFPLLHENKMMEFRGNFTSCRLPNAQY